MVPKPSRLGFFPIKNLSGSNHSDMRGLRAFLLLLDLARVGAMRGRMFRIPAYDPLAIAVMGCGIILAAAIAFPF